MDTKTLANLLRKLDEQSFRPGDSVVASTINHPIDAIGKFGGWLANQVNTAAGIPDQYDNPYPYLAPSPEAQTQAAFDVAGMAQLGSMPFAPKSAGGTVGTFIGPKAATWDAEKAATASKLLDEGVDPAQVWREHLIGRMPDGALFSEIDDSLSFMKPSNEWGWGNREGFKQGEMAIGSLDEFMNHKGIADNYPGFFDFGDDGRRMVMTIDKSAGEGGSFGDSSIRLGAIDSADGSSIANKSTALHELQHAIQQREGWASGGNPDMFDDPLLNDYLQQSYKAKHVQDIGQKADEYLKKGDYKKALDFERTAEVMAKHDAYSRLTGEAQARATQDRLNMNMDERRNNYPLAGGKLSDIPLEQLIYRYGDNGPAMSASDNLNAELLQKYLQQGSLTPDELAQYERNAVAMRDSNRQYLNVANADAQGGTAMDRAKAMGFDIDNPYYHATNSNQDWSVFDPNKAPSGEGVMFAADDPGAASWFAPGNNSRVMPVLLNKKNYGEKVNLNGDFEAQIYENFLKKIKEDEIDFAIFNNVNDPIPMDKLVMAKQPYNNFRSLFAAFDPLRKDSADLLATKLLPASMLGLGMYGMEQERRNPLAEALRGQ